jgi:hypothetical protein
VEQRRLLPAAKERQRLHWLPYPNGSIRDSSRVRLQPQLRSSGEAGKRGPYQDKTCLTFCTATLSRIDLHNACKVEIDVTSFQTVEDGRCVYRKGRVLNWWVDSKEYSIIDMEKDVVEHYSWTTNQEALFWYNGSNGQLRRLATDEELLTLLRSSKVVKFIMVVSNKQLGAENDVGELQNDNGRDRELQIIVRENKLPIEVMAENNGLLWAEEPEHGLTAAGPKRAEEEEVEHYMDLGFDAEGDDPTGADEEWRYFKNADFDHPTDARAADLDHPIEARLVDLDAVPNDEAAMIGDAIAAQTTYDRENPKIVVGSTFVDKDAFMLLIKQYAIINEFETFVVHSDRSRYRAKCADTSCDWKIHAKKLLGCPTFMVNVF